MTIAGFNFGCNDVKIAAWTASDTWGTAVDLVAAEFFNVQMRMENGELLGDDILVAVHAKIIAVEFRVKFAFRDEDVIPILTGVSATSTNANHRKFQFGNENMPWFGIAGAALHDGDAGDTQFFIPKAKLVNGFEFSMQMGQYDTPELSGIGVVDTGGSHDAFAIWQNNTATTLTIAPTPATS